MTSIRGNTYTWDDDRSPVELKPPSVPLDEAAAPINLAERNRCSACGCVPTRKMDGAFRDCLTPECAAKRAKLKKAAQSKARSLGNENLMTGRSYR